MAFTESAYFKNSKKAIFNQVHISLVLLSTDTSWANNSVCKLYRSCKNLCSRFSQNALIPCRTIYWIKFSIHSRYIAWFCWKYVSLSWSILFRFISRINNLARVDCTSKWIYSAVTTTKQRALFVSVSFFIPARLAPPKSSLQTYDNPSKKTW